MVDAAKAELAAELIRRFGELRLEVTGTSMLPAIRPHDVLVVRRCRPDEAAIGDVVLFARARRLFAHRVIRRAGAELLTRGDALAHADPPIGRAELLGKVVHVSRFGKPLRPHAAGRFAERLAASIARRSSVGNRLLVRLDGFQRSSVGNRLLVRLDGLRRRAAS